METKHSFFASQSYPTTPKQKYDWLFDQLSKLSSAKSFVHALHGTWDEASIKNIRNFINDMNEKLNG